MAPQTRGTSFPKILIERESDGEESSSDEELEQDDEEEEEELQNDAGEESQEEQVEEKDEASTSTKTGRKPITLSLKKVCKVSISTPFFSNV